MSKLICPDCRAKFKSIGFEFELWTTSFPVIPRECAFCHMTGEWQDQMVTGIPVMFTNIVMLKRRYPYAT